MKISNQGLYRVDFGKPDAGRGYSSFGGKSTFVVANSYGEASEKAMKYIEQEGPKDSALTGDGSINKDYINGFTIKAVNMVSQQFVY